MGVVAYWHPPVIRQRGFWGLVGNSTHNGIWPITGGVLRMKLSTVFAGGVVVVSVAMFFTPIEYRMIPYLCSLFLISGTLMLTHQRSFKIMDELMAENAELRRDLAQLALGQLNVEVQGVSVTVGVKREPVPPAQ